MPETHCQKDNSIDITCAFVVIFQFMRETHCQEDQILDFTCAFATIFQFMLETHCQKILSPHARFKYLFAGTPSPSPDSFGLTIILAALSRLMTVLLATQNVTL